MAGIGFTLRRMLDEGGLAGPLKAFSAAIVLASGPWVSSCLALALLGAWSALMPGSPDAEVFLSVVSHAFTCSLIAAGGLQMVAARFLADRLHDGRHQDVAPAFFQLLLPLWGLQAASAAAFLACVPLPLGVLAPAAALYLTLGGTWLAMGFLSAARRVGPQLIAFGVGAALGLGAGLTGGLVGGLAGQLAGFALGQALTFCWLLRELDRTFGQPRWVDVGLLGYVQRFPSLVLIGVCYNAGLWVDKLLFWHHPEAGRRIAGALMASPVYDEAMFLAYMSVLPALGLFMLKVETDFNDRFRAYFATIEAQRDMAAIQAAKAGMVEGIRRGLGLVIKVQAPITMALLVAAPSLSQALGLDWFSLSVFRMGVLGSFFHALHLMVLVLLLYLDFRAGALALAVFFLAANALGTTIAFAGGFAAYGLGALAAHLATLAFGWLLLEWIMARLEFHVFMRQTPRPQPAGRLFRRKKAAT